MLRSLPIKSRLILSGVGSVLAILITGGVGLFGLFTVHAALQNQTVAAIAIQQAMTADRMPDAVDADVMHAVLLGATGGPQAVTPLTEKLAMDVAVLRSSIATLDGMTLSEEARAQLDAVKPLAQAYLSKADETARLAFRDEVAGRGSLPEFLFALNALQQSLARLKQTVQADGDLVSRSAETLGKVLIVVQVALFAACAIGVVVSAWRLGQCILRPMDRLRNALGKVVQGDFAVRIGQITRDDDIGYIARNIDVLAERAHGALAEQAVLRADSDLVIAQLGLGLRNLATGDLSLRIEEPFKAGYEALRQDFNNTVETLSQMIGQVVEASESIRARSSEIGRAAEDLASRTETQASTLEETAAALEEITASVNTAAESAKEVEAVVLKARHDVEESGRVVQGAVTAMNEIEASSAQISQIIGVIDDIAFQTNLLALNAGVEAARAGDAGRGFAVVASEVRALAQRSSIAAKEIKVLISASSQHVHSGVQQVDSAGKALSAVVHQVAQISRLVSNIAAGSFEQAQGLNEINIGVAQLDQVTQHNAAMVEQSGAATQALTQEAVGMSNLVAQFAIRKERPRTNPAANWRPTVGMPPYARFA